MQTSYRKAESDFSDCSIALIVIDGPEYERFNLYFFAISVAIFLTVTFFHVFVRSLLLNDSLAGIASAPKVAFSGPPLNLMLSSTNFPQSSFRCFPSAFQFWNVMLPLILSPFLGYHAPIHFIPMLCKEMSMESLSPDATSVYETLSRYSFSFVVTFFPLKDRDGTAFLGLLIFFHVLRV